MSLHLPLPCVFSSNPFHPPPPQRRTTLASPPSLPPTTSPLKALYPHPVCRSSSMSPRRTAWSRKSSLIDGDNHPNPGQNISKLRTKYASPPPLQQHLKVAPSLHLTKKRQAIPHHCRTGNKNEKQSEIAEQLSVLPPPPLVIAATSKVPLSGLPFAYYKPGAPLAFSADTAPYVSPLQLKPRRGMLSSATVCLPNLPKSLVASVYAPKDPSCKDELGVIIGNLMQEHPLCIFTGDYNCTFGNVDAENVVHTPKWPWLPSSVYPYKPKLHDTFRPLHLLKRA